MAKGEKNMLNEAERLLKEREANLPDNLLKANEILISMLEKQPASSVGYERLCETLFWLGVYADNKSQKEKYFADGVEWGKKAVKAFPESGALNFWYAMHLALFSVAKGILKSLFNAPVIRKHGQKALDLDEAYFFGGPLRLMGRSYHKAPAGNLDKGIELLKKATEMHPDFLYNHLFLADAYISKGKRGDARELLRSIIAAPDPAEGGALLGLIRKEANEMLAKVA